MDEIKKTGGEKAATARSALVDLQTLVEGLAKKPPTTNLEELRTQAKTAYNAYDALYDFFDKETVTKITKTDDGKVVSETVNVKDVKADNAVKFLDNKEKDDFGYYQKGTGYQLAYGDLRGFRDLFDDVRYDISAAVNVINSGVDGALDLLEYKLTCTSTDASAIEECKNNLNLLLGTDWEGHDSGHRIYSATELRNLRHDEEGHHHIGGEFFYDYKSSYNFSTHAYIDQDNGIYNNVFPYNEKGDLTRYYPYLMVPGRAIADGGSNDKGLVATEMLFHYGDWLTADMIAEDPVNHKYHIQKSPEEQQKELLQSVSAQVSDLQSTINKFIADSSNWNNKTDSVETAMKNALTKANATVQKFADNKNDVSLDAVKQLYNQLKDFSGELDTLWTTIKDLKVNGTGKNQAFNTLKTNLDTSINNLKTLMSNMQSLWTLE